MEKELKQIIEGMVEMADKEREGSQPYKNLFKRTNNKPFPVQLREVETDMVSVVLQYTQILKENGYKVTNDFLLALPAITKFFEKEIKEKDGYACDVDKTYYLLHERFKELLEKE